LPADNGTAARFGVPPAAAAACKLLPNGENRTPM
jgi:hypothetical protein